jgi:hypothetical protein
MISRRFVLTGIVAAPAVITYDNLMHVHPLPQRYATVWGVGHDLEVIEHVLWEPISVAGFGSSPAIDKFREVTDWEYGFPVDPLYTETRRRPVADTASQRPDLVSTRYYGDHLLARFNNQDQILQDNGFTKNMGYHQMEEWLSLLRPDLPGGRSSEEWMRKNRLARDDYNQNKEKYIEEALLSGIVPIIDPGYTERNNVIEVNENEINPYALDRNVIQVDSKMQKYYDACHEWELKNNFESPADCDWESRPRMRDFKQDDDIPFINFKVPFPGV